MKKYIAACALLATDLSAYTAQDAALVKEMITDEIYGITGWCSVAKAIELIDLILVVEPEVYVEIGVYEGASFFPAAAALKFLGKGTAFAVDPWDTFECVRYFDPVLDEKQWKWWASIDLEKAYKNFKRMLNIYRLEGVSKILRKTSLEAASEFDAIDILHLDGDHSEAMSVKDVETYLPKVRQGGYVWLNDSLWKERAAAVDLLLEACDVVKVIESANCILFRKR